MPKNQLQFKHSAGRMWIKLWGQVEHQPQISTPNIFRWWKYSTNISKFQIPFWPCCSAQAKKLFWRFFKHDTICVYAKFEVWLTPGTGFLASDDTFLTNIKKFYFSPYLWGYFDQLKLKFKNLEQNWVKTGPLLLKILDSPISMDSCIVHW